MAVIAVTDKVVWSGGNRRVCMAIFDYCESSLGKRAFIDRFKTSFANGYNNAELDCEDDDAVRDFRACVNDLAENAGRFNEDWLESAYDAESVRRSLKDLVGLIDRERLDAS